MSEMKVEVSPRVILSAAVVIIGVVLIVHSAFIALMGVENITELIGTEISYDQAFLNTLGWFFGLLIEVLGGFFLGIIGTRFLKK